jgi:hypothetical protein
MLRATHVPVLVLALAGACTSASPGPQAAAPAGAQPQETAPVQTQSDRPCAYKTTELSGPGQVQVECPDGQTFVLRRAADGTWSEEAKSRAGTRPTWKSLDEAARARCGCE